MTISFWLLIFQLATNFTNYVHPYFRDVKYQISSLISWFLLYIWLKLGYSISTDVLFGGWNEHYCEGHV